MRIIDVDAHLHEPLDWVEQTDPALAEALQLELDELLPMGETLQLLGLAVLEEGDIRLLDPGRRFVDADTDARKAIFGAALRASVPLAAQIRRVLEERPNHRAAAVRFRDEYLTPFAVGICVMFVYVSPGIGQMTSLRSGRLGEM